MREIVQLAVIIAIVITKGRFIAGARSGAPQRSKMGNLSMRENLVMMSAYAHPYVRTGREVLSGLCRGGGWECKTCSFRLYWRNVSQFI